VTYEVDFERANRIWPGEPRLTTLEDLYSVTVDIDGTPQTRPTHLFNGPLKLIPYKNPRVAADGTDAIAECFPPGAVGFAIKHRRTQHRLLRLRASDAAALSDPTHLPVEYTGHIKLQDIHVAAVVGVPRPGHTTGAIVPIGAPTRYRDALFYRDNYPMIFVEPVFPGLTDQERRQHYLNNLRAMLVCFALVTRTTPDYNEQNLPATTPEAIALWTEMMIRAFAGEQPARAFFRQTQNSVYCGEFIFIATCAALAWPLNRATWEPRVGAATWRAFVEAVELHNKRAHTALAARRGYYGKRLFEVRLELAPNDLSPFSTELAFAPMPLVDIIEAFIRAYWPREHDERLGVLQSAVVKALVPAFSALAGRGAPGLSDKDRQEYDQLWHEVVATIATPRPSYAAFRESLAPVHERVEAFLTRHGRQHLAIPPSLFHLVAQGSYPNRGALGLAYVGHGIHRDVLV